MDEYYYDFEFRGIENVQDLFKILDYKPTLVKSGYNNNYIQYGTEVDKILTVEEYLALIEPYLRELINDYKSKGEWKIQLTVQINFISVKSDSDETCVMHTKSHNEEFVNGCDTDEIIKELFKSLLQRYQENLQEKMRGSDFAFDSVNFLYYDFDKISISRGGSYIDSPKWLKNKKSTINPRNNDYKCFQYAVTLALNLDKINKHSQRVSKIKPFIEQYNWKDTDFRSTSKDWKKFELNNEIALNILYVPHNTKKIEIAYKSKYNLTREKQVILLMISNGENWHYLVVKSLSGLLTGITSNHKEDFYCLNCCHSYRAKNKLESYKKICENRNYCNVEMPNEGNKVILLMISNGGNWHYLVVKSLSGLLTGITSNHKEDFYCLNCCHSYRTKNKLESYKKICENRNYCNVEMPNEGNKIIKYNQGEKSIKSPFIIYADLE